MSEFHWAEHHDDLMHSDDLMDLQHRHVEDITQHSLPDHSQPDLTEDAAEHGVETSRQYFGTPMEDAAHWEHQTTPFTCAVEAQRGVLEAVTGEYFSEAELAAEAAEHGWLHTRFSDEGAGTPVVDIGNLLELHGVETHKAEDVSVGNLVSELAAGHKVIVGVNSSDLWNPTILNHLTHHGADHAIWVTGVDTSDPDNVNVIINDSGDPHGAGKAYSLAQFTDAWEDSGHFYLATNHAQPDLHVTSPAFDQTEGVFPAMVVWARDHALPLSLGAGALMVSGLAVSDLMGGKRLTESSRATREKITKNQKLRGGDPDMDPIY